MSRTGKRSRTLPTLAEPIQLAKRSKNESEAVLFQPFRSPFAQLNKPVGSLNVSARGRTRTVVNYAEGITGGNDDSKDMYTEDSIVRGTVRGLAQRGVVVRRSATIDGTCSDTIVVEGVDNSLALDKLSKKFTIPFKDKSLAINRPPPPVLGSKRQPIIAPRPLHDPAGEFAIVLYDPTIDVDVDEEAEEAAIKAEKEAAIAAKAAEAAAAALSQNSMLPSPPLSSPPQSRIAKRNDRSIAEMLGIDPTGEEKKKKFPNVPVVIDPKLSKILRPHQIEGVKFLYRCCTGRVVPRAYGCIMADEMGLGKTLQCIALLWTLLKQSPQGSQKATIQKCVITCPSSLVRNWANELDKWLGKGAVTPLAMDGGKSTKGAKGSVGTASADKSVNNGYVATLLRQWAQAKGRQIVRPILIISYETLRRNVGDLKDADIGLLLCDEGHRLKNGESLTFTALDSLNCKRRVILSGTPIQNDLSEYFSLLNFANPGLLGSRGEFRKNYELDILRGRDANSTDDEVAKGTKKLQELSAIVSPLIIRRTNDILSKYLPVKYEHVVFCHLSPFQHQLYNHFNSSPEIKSLLRGKGSQALKAISLLRKLCTHPDLLDLPNDIEGCEDILPEDFVPKDSRGRGSREVKTWYSGKLTVLERMLARIRAETNDKIVLISNFTQTLDIIQNLCRERRYGCLRLDGTLSINKRQKLVDRFNDLENTNDFIFLLSSKAGGCGINLIGANRLILLDPDWNPAADQQALARVWRDGQKKDCFVYRFISTGTIEENIFQRQSMKQSLSSCVVDEKEDVDRLFSSDNLRELFNFRPNTVCDTHDTFKCKRCREGKQFIKSPALLYGDANTWNHFTNPELDKIQDLLLRQECGNDIVSFVFQYISH